MNSQKNQVRRAALLLAAPALLATPALAQDTTPAAPPVTQASPPAAPTPATPPRAVPTSPRVGQVDSPTPVNPEAAAQAAAEDSAGRTVSPSRPARQPFRSARHAPAPARLVRSAPVAPSRPSAPVAAEAPAAPSTPAPVATPSPVPTAAAPVPAATPTAVTTSETQTTTQQGSLWPWVLLALLGIGGIAAFAALRRRSAAADRDNWAPAYVEPAHVEPAHVEPAHVEPAHVEPAHVEPAHVEPAYVAPTHVEPAHAGPLIEPVAAAAAIAAIPAAAARIAPKTRVRPTAAAPAANDAFAGDAATPVSPDDAVTADASDADVAALTAATPVSDRPWLEFAMRPLRAGSNVDEAMVEIELTVGNAGQVSAEDVRISTFMLERGDAAEMERVLAGPPNDADVAPVTIAPGEGTRVDATLAMLKTTLTDGGAGFKPTIVADARYRMADGREGRTSASFVVGVASEGSDTLAPIAIDRPIMRDDVEARLFQPPRHS